MHSALVLITRRVKHSTAKNKRSSVLSALLNAKSVRGTGKKNVLAWSLKRLNGRKKERNVNV